MTTVGRSYLRQLLPRSAIYFGGALNALIGFAPRCAAQVTEELYGLEGWPIVGLVRLDQASGAILDGHRADAPAGFVYHGLTFDGTRFLAPLIGGQGTCYWVSMNPSLGFRGTPTVIAGTFANMSVDIDPTTGRIWGVGQDWIQTTTQLWEFDRTTGLAVSHGLLGGATSFATGIAFDQTGTCYITDALGPRVMTLDLGTRTATVIGTLNLGSGLFWDITMSCGGEIWGGFGGAGPNQAATGLYRFDPATLAPTFVKPLLQAYMGLAFARYPSPVLVCPGKVNSQGCTPSIEVEGFPSATGNLGFYVRARNVVNQTLGMLLVSVTGTASTPFSGGTLCIASPYYRTLPRTSGGNPGAADCSGMWELDLEQEIRRREYLSLPPIFSAGQTVSLQWIGRDRALGPPHAISLSGTLSVTLMP